MYAVFSYEMIATIEEINARAISTFQGMDKAIGGTGYFWPRLTALRDAIARGIV